MQGSKSGQGVPPAERRGLMKVVLVTDHAWPDLSIERKIFEAAGLSMISPESPAKADLMRQARGASAIMTCFSRVGADVIASSPDLRVVARFGTGVDMIDVSAAKQHGVTVTNVPDYCSDEVADHAIAMILAALRDVVTGDRRVRAGLWGPDFQSPPRAVAGSTLGLVGFGKIGRAVARRGRALGMRILVWSWRLSMPEIAEAGAEPVSLQNLAQLSDVVSLHLPLTSETNGIIDAEFLAQMREGAWLVNTARGALVDERALTEALRSGRICGAALDVIAAEPPDPDWPLLSIPNVILTPHIAFYSDAAVQRMRRLACEDVVRVVADGLAPMRPVG